jgi:hypothetical protein
MKVNFLERVLWWVLASTAVLNTGTALAFCDEHPDLPAELKKSDPVITAVVESQRSVSSPDDPQGVEETIYTVRVLHVFKGRPDGLLEISSENTSSRFPMEVGKEYLLFVRWSWEGEFYVDSCGNSGLLKDSKAEIEELGKILNGRSP